MKYKIFCAVILLTVFFILFKTPLFAAVRCETQYGGEVCVKLGELEVNKLVWDPVNNQFVDNLDLTDHKFSPGDEVAFQIRIKNTGDATLDGVKIKDTLPSFLEKVSGDWEFTLNDLTAGETETRDLRARVKSVNSLPSDQNVICDVNVAEAEVDGQREKDVAKVCIVKEVAKAAVLPVTGPDSSSDFFCFSIIGGLTGVAFIITSRRP